MWWEILGSWKYWESPTWEGRLPSPRAGTALSVALSDLLLHAGGLKKEGG